MNSKLFRYSLPVLSLAILTLAFNGRSVQAQTEKISHQASDLTVEQTTLEQATNSLEKEAEADNSTSEEVAQVDVRPGQATVSGSSYIGVGGNIGLTGGQTIGEGAFSVISKIGLTDNISVRPSAHISGDAVFLIPLTADFPIRDVAGGEVSLAPFVGGGLAVATEGDDNVGGVITGGVDVPISPEFTATGAVNVGFLDDTNVGITLGVGYNF
jgi:hypothetical protein